MSSGAHLSSTGTSMPGPTSRGRAVSRCNALQPLLSSALTEAPAESSAPAAAEFMDHAAASRGEKPRPSSACRRRCLVSRGCLHGRKRGAHTLCAALAHLCTPPDR